MFLNNAHEFLEIANKQKDSHATWEKKIAKMLHERFPEGEEYSFIFFTKSGDTLERVFSGCYYLDGDMDNITDLKPVVELDRVGEDAQCNVETKFIVIE